MLGDLQFKLNIFAGVTALSRSRGVRLGTGGRGAGDRGKCHLTPLILWGNVAKIY